jgi:hypothetical protein
MRNIYGITQNPNTKEYFMILQDGYCEKCGKKQVNTTCIWCKSFQISHNFSSINENSNLSNYNSYKFDFNFTSNKDDFKEHHITSKNEKNKKSISLIPYSQFNNIKEIGKGGFTTVYSAIWENDSKEATNKKVALKCLHNSQNITKDYFDKVYKIHLLICNFMSFNIIITIFI